VALANRGLSREVSLCSWTTRPIGREESKRWLLTARGPLRAILFFLILSMAASGMAVLPSLRMGVTSQDSQAIGVCSNAYMLAPSSQAGGAYVRRDTRLWY
jgi:hypothetical protein